jgi:uncharacterized protein YegP (UPF0339 family)
MSRARGLIFRMYRDKRRLWRWRLKSPNGRIIADSAQGYKRKANVMKAIDIITRDIFCGDYRIESA